MCAQGATSLFKGASLLMLRMTATRRLGALLLLHATSILWLVRATSYPDLVTESEVAFTTAFLLLTHRSHDLYA